MLREIHLYPVKKMSTMILSPALDISADLTELGRTPIAVVSAGVKSILDIGRTLEFLVRILIILLSHVVLSHCEKTLNLVYSITLKCLFYILNTQGFQ